MAPIFTTKPPVTAGISSMEIAQIVKFMTEHFQVEQPKIKISNTTRRGKYSVLHQTIIMGPKSWRGAHTVVHEFAHHLDMVRRGHAGTWMRQPRTVVNGWTTRFGRREFHGESFVLALEDCVMAVFGDQNLYAWEAEYKSVMKNHAKRFVHRDPNQGFRNGTVSFPVRPPGGCPGSRVRSAPRWRWLLVNLKALCAERRNLQSQVTVLTNQIKAARSVGDTATAARLFAHRATFNKPYNDVIAKIKVLKGGN